VSPSNGIGQFVIGESQIGDAPFAWENTLFSQYSNSPVILSLLDNFSQAVGANAAVDGFYDQVWNVDTAVGYGLDVWGRIVGLNTGRILPVSDSVYLGFSEAGNIAGIANTWGHGTWYSGPKATNNISLSDDAFRVLILAKAASNIWDGSIPGLNKILRLLFPGQVAYCTDGLDMTMTYVFDFPLTPAQISILFNSNILPRPAGVSATIIQL
jgi:hypothetical protein